MDPFIHQTPTQPHPLSSPPPHSTPQSPPNLSNTGTTPLIHHHQTQIQMQTHPTTSTLLPTSSTQSTLHPTSTKGLPISSTGKITGDRYNSPAGNLPTAEGLDNWETAFERQRLKRWEEKVGGDLGGWRGGIGPPRSNYAESGTIPTNSYYNSQITGTIGKHLPKEIIRIERDWSDGEVCQFETSFPMELEGRISPRQYQTFITDLNAQIAFAYSIKGAVLDNLIAIATWWTSLMWKTSHFEKELRKAERIIDGANRDLFEGVGLRVLSPRDVALQFLEIEYY